MALPDPLLGKKLGDYTVESLLGKGGMARVYKGYDEALDRYAALKVIAGEFSGSEEAEYTDRFQREARAIARLRHPHIVGIYQFGQAFDLYYMAMVFLDGVDLRMRLRQLASTGKRMPISEVLKMSTEIADALDYAHKQGVIHRDIKPSNIMMTPNGAVLTDFGLALSTQEGTQGDTFGSAHYIAPEQAVSSARAVPQSDLYSLGIVIYECLAGTVPFDDPSAMSVALKHLNEPPPPIRMFNPELPQGIEEALSRVLRKDPRDRYQSGREFIRALYAAVDKKPSDIASDLPSLDETWGERPSALNKPSVKEGGDVSLESYLASLKQGAHVKRPSIAKNILADIIDTPSPVPSPSQSRPDKPSSQRKPLTPRPTSKSSSAETKSPVTSGGATTPLVQQTDPEKANKKRRLPLILLAVVVLLLVVGGLAFALTGGGENGQNKTQVSGGNPSPTMNPVETTPPTDDLPNQTHVAGTAQAGALLSTNQALTQEALMAEADMTTSAVALSITQTAEAAASQIVPTEETPPPTETLTNSPTRTRQVSPTPTDTVTPTHTRTRAVSPSPTFSPTASATRTPNRTPSDTPTPTPTERLPSITPTGDAIQDPTPTLNRTLIALATQSAPEIRLEYTKDYIKLINISSRRQNIGSLEFRGNVEGRFYGNAWTSTLEDESEIFRIREDGCFQIVIDPDYVNSEECRFYNAWIVRQQETSHFWRSEVGNTSFSVYKSGQLIAECQVSAGVCQFAIP